MGTHPIFESDFDCLTEQKCQRKKKKLTDAMQKPEFRELLFDYVKEIQDPANREQYESELKKYEEQLAQEARVEELRKTQTKNNIAPEVKTEANKEAKSKSKITGNRRGIINDDIF